MHRGYVGDSRHRKGNGKTITAVRQINKLYRSKKYKIYSNIALSIPHTLISPWDLVNLARKPGALQHSIFFLDEIQNIFNSIGKGTANLVFNFIQNQTRKGDTHLIWTSQRLKNVDNRITDDAMVFHCSKWHEDNSRCYDSEDKCIKSHIIKVREMYSGRGFAYRLIPSLFELYDTAEVVPLAFFQNKKLRDELTKSSGMGDDGIKTLSEGNVSEVEFIKALKMSLGSKTIIRHNARYNDGRISLFDVEVELNGKLFLFDVVGSSHDQNRKHQRLNSKKKNWADKLNLAAERNARAYMTYKNGSGWKGLELVRGAEWMDLKGMITLTEKRINASHSIDSIFNQ